MFVQGPRLISSVNAGFPNAIVGDPNGRPVMISSSVMAYSDANGVPQTVTLLPLPTVDGTTIGVDKTTLLPNNGATVHVGAGKNVIFNVDNTLLDGYDFNLAGIGNVRANGCVVSRCWFHNIDGQDNWGIITAPADPNITGLTIQDCLCNGTSSSITGPDGLLKSSTAFAVQVIRCHTFNCSSAVQFVTTLGSGTEPYTNIVKDCYFEAPSDPSAFGLHLEDINLSSGTGGLLLQHNHITGPNGQTATVYFTTDAGDEGNIHVDNNLLDGFSQNTQYIWGGGAGGVLIAAANNFKFTNNKVANTGGQNPGSLAVGVTLPDSRVFVSGNVYYPSLTPIPGF